MLWGGEPRVPPIIRDVICKVNHCCEWDTVLDSEDCNVNVLVITKWKQK